MFILFHIQKNTKILTFEVNFLTIFFILTQRTASIFIFTKKYNEYFSNIFYILNGTSTKL